MIYFNEQIKQLYNVTEKDYVDWCKKHNKPMSYKSTISDFVWRLRTGRLVKDNYGRLLAKRPRRKK